jgi:hypothetical protein
MGVGLSNDGLGFGLWILNPKDLKSQIPKGMIDSKGEFQISNRMTF